MQSRSSARRPVGEATTIRQSAFEPIYTGLYELDDPSRRGEIGFSGIEDSSPWAGAQRT
jgi:hypothetical protein